MDLKKLFVYVPETAESDFIKNVINTDKAKEYANKIVFLEGSQRIWVKKKFYGSDPAEVIAITTKLDSLGNAIATSGDGLIYTDGSYSFSKSFNGGTASTSVVKYAEAIGTYAVNAGGAAADAQGRADDAYTLAESAYSYADNIGHDLDTFKKKVGNVDSLGAYSNLRDYIDAKDKSARTEIKVEGSGLTYTKTPGADGHDIYTIIADSKIWEFMGSATVTLESDVASELNAQYDGESGTGEGKIHRNPEKGDVWDVTVGTGSAAKEILYACSSVTGSAGTWVAIGGATGVIDATGGSNGISLSNVNNVATLSVAPGSVENGDTSVVTGGAVFDAVETRIPNIEKGAKGGVAPLNADGKIDNTYISYTNDIAEDSYLPLTSYGAYAVITANERTTSAALNDLKNADTAIIDSYKAADAETLEAAKTYTGEEIGKLGAASKKGVDESITSSEYTSTDLPTTAAVASYVAGLGLKDASKKGVANTIAPDGPDLPTAATVYSYVGGNVASIVTNYQNADEKIINSYEAADTALNDRINNLDAAYTYSYSYSSDVLYSYNLTQSDGLITVAQVVFNGDVMHNMVVDNLWEVYSA